MTTDPTPTVAGTIKPTDDPYVCPDCGRDKALTMKDAAKGNCPKWWAVMDQAAENDCKRHRAAITPAPTDAEPVAWLIDLDGTGSLHPASKGDPGAIPVYEHPDPVPVPAYETAELVKRLRAPAYWMSGSGEGHEGENDAPYRAADRLKALSAENARLQNQFARATDGWSKSQDARIDALERAEKAEAEVARLTKELARKDAALQHLRGLYDCGDVVDAALAQPADTSTLREKISNLIIDSLVDAEIDFPAGRDAGPSINWDHDQLMNDVESAIFDAQTEQPGPDAVAEAERCIICDSPHMTRGEMTFPDGRWVCSRPCELAAEAVRKAKEATVFRDLAKGTRP